MPRKNYRKKGICRSCNRYMTIVAKGICGTCYEHSRREQSKKLNSQTLRENTSEIINCGMKNTSVASITTIQKMCNARRSAAKKYDKGTPYRSIPFIECLKCNYYKNIKAGIIPPELNIQINPKLMEAYQ